MVLSASVQQTILIKMAKAKAKKEEKKEEAAPEGNQSIIDFGRYLCTVNSKLSARISVTCPTPGVGTEVCFN